MEEINEPSSSSSYLETCQAGKRKEQHKKEKAQKKENKRRKNAFGVDKASLSNDIVVNPQQGNIKLESGSEPDPTFVVKEEVNIFEETSKCEVNFIKEELDILEEGIQFVKEEVDILEEAVNSSDEEVDSSEGTESSSEEEGDSPEETFASRRSPVVNRRIQREYCRDPRGPLSPKKNPYRNICGALQGDDRIECHYYKEPEPTIIELTDSLGQWENNLSALLEKIKELKNELASTIWKNNEHKNSLFNKIIEIHNLKCHDRESIVKENSIKAVDMSDCESDEEIEMEAVQKIKLKAVKKIKCKTQREKQAKLKEKNSDLKGQCKHSPLVEKKNKLEQLLCEAKKEDSELRSLLLNKSPEIDNRKCPSQKSAIKENNGKADKEMERVADEISERSTIEDAEKAGSSFPHSEFSLPVDRHESVNVDKVMQQLKEKSRQFDARIITHFGKVFGLLLEYWRSVKEQRKDSEKWVERCTRSLIKNSREVCKSWKNLVDYVLYEIPAQHAKLPDQLKDTTRTDESDDDVYKRSSDDESDKEEIVNSGQSMRTGGLIQPAARKDDVAIAVKNEKESANMADRADDNSKNRDENSNPGTIEHLTAQPNTTNQNAYASSADKIIDLNNLGTAEVGKDEGQLYKYPLELKGSVQSFGSSIPKDVCDYCGRQFYSNQGLSRHQKGRCPIIEGRRTSRVSKDGKKAKMHCCGKCGFVSKYWKSLDRHIKGNSCKTQLSKGVYACERCGKKIPLKNPHLKEACDLMFAKKLAREKALTCHVCKGNAFCSRQAFNQHMLRFHGGNK